MMGSARPMMTCPIMTNSNPTFTSLAPGYRTDLNVEPWMKAYTLPTLLIDLNVGSNKFPPEP